MRCCDASLSDASAEARVPGVVLPALGERCMDLSGGVVADQHPQSVVAPVVDVAEDRVGGIVGIRTACRLARRRPRHLGGPEEPRAKPVIDRERLAEPHARARPIGVERSRLDEREPKQAPGSYSSSSPSTPELVTVQLSLRWVHTQSPEQHVPVQAAWP